ncbi:MAG: hypothetical protein ACKVOW_15650 [Chitinophagaceae bacterium]
MANKKINISNKKVAYAGAKLAVAAVFSYSLIIMLYAIIRSTITICNIMPVGERNNILMQNGFSIAYSVAIFSLLMALLSAISGAIAGVIFKMVLQYFNPNFGNRKAIVISCITAFATLVILYLLLYALLKNWMTFTYIETFSFWFLLPAVIFFGLCIIGGSKLNKGLNK